MNLVSGNERGKNVTPLFPSQPIISFLTMSLLILPTPIPSHLILSTTHRGSTPQLKSSSRVTPYPTFASIYGRSAQCVIDGDMFEDLYLADFVDANKRWERVLTQISHGNYNKRLPKSA
jgi:hypothetical protein